MSGVRIHADTVDAPAWKSESKQDLLCFVALLGAGGPMEAIETFRADKEAVSFDGFGFATGSFADYMAQRVSLGTPGESALFLNFGSVTFPGWTADHKLSGISHALWELRFDNKGNHYGAGVPEPEWIGKWVKVYDPRKDDTYPGGSGSHRALDESTYEWSANPALHALTWCLGRWQNGKRTLGIGAPVDNIRVADFVEAANVADANGWTCGGVEWSTDSKWSILKRMLQAGGAEPTMTGAMIGCRVNTPRVSIATVTADKLLDSLSMATTKSRRDRFNTVIPRYRSEEHDWEAISGSPVAVAQYITEDGGPRTKEIDFPLVQHETGGTGNTQAGQLAAYEIVNSREAGPIRFTVGPEYIGVKTGDVITLDVPDEGLAAQPVLIRSRSIDPTSFKITFEAETETTAKHDFALGKTTTPPPTYEPTPPDLTPPTPSAVLWTLTAGYAGEGIPSITVSGVCEFPGADSVLLEYRIVGSVDWLTLGKAEASAPVKHVVSPVDGATQYEARVAYQSGNRIGGWLALAAVTTPAALTLDAHLSPSDVLYVPADKDGNVTSYSPAAGTFIIASQGGTDIGASFTLSTPAGGNPDGLTVGYVGRNFSVTAGIDSSSSEDQVSLTIRATGSGNYAGIVIDRRLMIVKDYGTAVVPFVANANDRNGLTPDTPGGTLTLSHSVLPSGNVRLKGTVTFTHNADPDHKNNIDGFEIGVYSATTNDGHAMDGTAADEDWHYVISDLSEASHEFVFAADVAAPRFYKVGVRAVRQVHTDVSSIGFIKSGIKSNSGMYQPSTSQNYTGDIDGVPAGDITTAVENVNADNDGNGLQPDAPTSVTIASTTYPDSTAAVAVSWTFTESSDPAHKNSIDGYWAGLRIGDTSAGYTYNPADANTFRWQFIRPGVKRANWNGMPSAKWYTGVVIAVRKVRTNVDPDGEVLGLVGQSSSTTPHQPSATVNFTGSIDSETAANIKTWSTRAGVAITSTNNIATGRVLTGSILDDAINQADWAAQGATIALGENDSFASTFLTLESTGSHLRAQFVLDYQVGVTDPVEDEEVSFTVKIWAQRVSSGADSYSDTLTVTEVWNAPDATGTKKYPRQMIAFEYPFEALAGSVASPVAYDIGYLIETGAGLSVTCNAYRYIRASDERASQ